MEIPKFSSIPDWQSTATSLSSSSRSYETAQPPVKPKKDEPSMASQESEPLTLSPLGQEIKQYSNALANLPDIRLERVTQIQKALKNGTYAISSQNLADKLIQEISSLSPDSSSSSA
ncbi:MAG: flagellar biosynthesis anti-sigma factor FlgM [Nitrospirota bacterium]|nr:flagellar biosynthesis anti-sigma factor FlgM [Nitrospirota bacterium]MDH5585100.1 flagellar biosynthesis anti-sigma factor FlgM [Nitrospirota bacterium]MDH5774740.1 flagellar biosynthesis anti-sigma factor FlgM [Nitrospirota bacterium]